LESGKEMKAWFDSTVALTTTKKTTGSTAHI